MSTSPVWSLYQFYGRATPEASRYLRQTLATAAKPLMLAAVLHADKSGAHMTDAKAAHDRIIDKAAAEDPQAVTRHGRKTEVIVDTEERGRQTRRSGSLAAFFAHSPLPESGLEIERRKDGLRDIDL